MGFQRRDRSCRRRCTARCKLEVTANNGLHRPANRATASQNCVFCFNEVAFPVSVQLAPTAGHSTLRCQALKPDTAFRPLPPYQNLYSKNWLLLVTTPRASRGNTLLGGMWGAILRVWLDAGYVLRGEAFSVAWVNKDHGRTHKMTQISAEKGHRWPVS